MGRIPMMICKFCHEPFVEVKPWQVYCSYRCQQDWYLEERKRATQERLYAKLVREREGVMNGHHSITPEQQEKALVLLKDWIDNIPIPPKKPKRAWVRPKTNRAEKRARAEARVKSLHDKAEERAKSQEILDRFIEEGRREEPKLLRRL